jgi:hypothetical protein
VRLLRLAEVTVREPPEVGAVLLRERLVEAVVLAERLDGGGILDRALAEVRGRGVARYELREQKRDQRDADAEEDEGDEPPADESKEGVGRPLARSSQPDRQSEWLTLSRQR